MKSAKKIVMVALSIILWAVILLAALFAFTTLATRDSAKVASLAGYTPMVVKSDSMAPTFKAGDLIVIRKCDPAKLEEGDIITFHTIIMNEYALNTHRIVKIDEQNGYRSYTTMGDNNNGIADTHIISDSDIVGRYVGKVSGLGRVMDFMSSSVGFLLVIVLPMLLFFIYQVYHLIMVGINLKKAVAVENAVAQQAAVEAQGGNETADEAKRMKAEAEAALAEAKRMKEEAEAALAQARKDAEKRDEQV
ncbi:MAG: signal peptidase I [Clostridiales bacterium]|nr:signal peptidase I [Clostridiales bacterium]